MSKGEKIFKIFFSSASLIVFLILTVNLLSVLGWLIKIPITPYHFPIACIISILINYFIQKQCQKIEFKEYIISILIVILTICSALIIANQFLDVSYDGAWYHSIAIIKMKEGWNPIYELINSGQFGDVYIDSYSNKSIWSFGACVYALFNNINSIKIISSIMAFAVTFLAISIFGKWAKTKTQFLIIIIASICIGFNPIYLEQMYTNYIDSTLGLYCIFYVLLFISYYAKQTDFTNISFSALIISCIALMTNTKLTGLYFAATFFGFYVIIQIIKELKSKKFNFKWFKKMFITGFIGVALAFIIGINPFITNLIHGHNMFYPILGSEKIEVMGANIPESIRSKSNLEKLIIVNFSESINSTAYRDTKLQNPLAITENNNYQNLNQDTRVGAFGAIFSLSLYITILSLIFYSKKLLKKEPNSLIKSATFWTILYIFLNAIIFSESWWGRYYPILYTIPIILAIYYFLQESKSMKVIAIIIIGLLAFNNYQVAKATYNYQVVNSKSTTDFISKIENKKIVFWCYDPDKKWDYSYQTYFKEHNIQAISADSNIEDYDYKGFNIEIKVLENK